MSIKIAKYGNFLGWVHELVGGKPKLTIGAPPVPIAKQAFHHGELGCAGNEASFRLLSSLQKYYSVSRTAKGF